MLDFPYFCTLFLRKIKSLYKKIIEINNVTNANLLSKIFYDLQTLYNLHQNINLFININFNYKGKFYDNFKELMVNFF